MEGEEAEEVAGSPILRARPDPGRALQLQRTP